MGYDIYFYGIVLIALVIYGVRYAYAKFHCKKCGSWSSEVRSHFEMNAGTPHAFVQARYCCHCDEPIVEVARIQIKDEDIVDNRGEE